MDGVNTPQDKSRKKIEELDSNPCRLLGAHFSVYRLELVRPREENPSKRWRWLYKTSTTAHCWGDMSDKEKGEVSLHNFEQRDLLKLASEKFVICLFLPSLHSEASSHVFSAMISMFTLASAETDQEEVRNQLWRLQRDSHLLVFLHPERVNHDNVLELANEKIWQTNKDANTKRCRPPIDIVGPSGCRQMAESWGISDFPCILHLDTTAWPSTAVNKIYPDLDRRKVFHISSQGCVRIRAKIMEEHISSSLMSSSHRPRRLIGEELFAENNFPTIIFAAVIGAWLAERSAGKKLLQTTSRMLMRLLETQDMSDLLQAAYSGNSLSYTSATTFSTLSQDVVEHCLKYVSYCALSVCCSASRCMRGKVHIFVRKQMGIHRGTKAAAKVASDVVEGLPPVCGDRFAPGEEGAPLQRIRVAHQHLLRMLSVLGLPHQEINSTRDAHKLAGNCAFRLKQYDEAIKHYLKAAGCNFSDSTALEDQNARYLHFWDTYCLGSRSRATRQLAETRHKALCNIVLCHIRSRRYRDALSLSQYIVDEQPSNWLGFFRLAQSLLHLSRYDEAKKICTKLLAGPAEIGCGGEELAKCRLRGLLSLIRKSRRGDALRFAAKLASLD